MKNMFPGYIRPTKDEFRDLWDNCIFSLDANVLLRLYEYTPETREDFIKVLDKIAPRAWLTHQAAWEYMRRRLKVIHDQIDKIDNIKKELELVKKKTLGTIAQINRHPFFHGKSRKQISNSISRTIGNLSKKIDDILAARERDYPDWDKWQDNDPILNNFLELFDGKIGAPYDEATYNNKLEEALKRCQDNTPPGYKDCKKEENKFGDILIWFQLLDKASKDKKPIIFITGDSKEDWWSRFENKSRGKIIGPRPRLVQEFLRKTEQQYYQYQPLTFLELAKEYFSLVVREESIAEVEEISNKVDEYTNNRTIGNSSTLEEKFLEISKLRSLPTHYTSDIINNLQLEDYIKMLEGQEAHAKLFKDSIGDSAFAKAIQIQQEREKMAKLIFGENTIDKIISEQNERAKKMAKFIFGENTND